MPKKLSPPPPSRAPGRPGAAILLYHRIADDVVDPFGNRVTPVRFAQHLEVLRRHFRPLSLRELASRRDRAALPERAIAVSFDDGYADNLHVAKPLLARAGIPATVFVTTGKLDSPREFWWDELQRLLLEPVLLPERLSIRLGGHTHAWELGSAPIHDLPGQASQRDWTAYGAPDPSPRHRAFRELWRLLRPLDLRTRELLLEEITAWAGGIPPGESRRAMTREEVVELARGGLVDIGAHTVTHPVIGSVPLRQQAAEIRGSRAALRELLGRDVPLFAYPFGRRGDYRAETVELIRSAGFAAAFTTRAALVRRSSYPWELPRLSVWNWDGEQFERWLDAWFAR